jgi:hypothetical protein
MFDRKRAMFGIKICFVFNLNSPVMFSELDRVGKLPATTLSSV